MCKSPDRFLYMFTRERGRRPQGMEEPEKESKEGEETEHFLRAWDEIVLGDPKVAVSRDKEHGEDLKVRLYDSLIESTGKLLEEWGLVPDKDDLRAIAAAADSDTRANLERAYLKQMHAAVSAHIDGFDRSEPKSSMWNSWPSVMRKERTFNCVGAAIVGAALMERAEMDVRVASAPSHVFNLIRLSNGELWYADFMNAKKALKKIEAEETMLEGVPALRIHDKDLRNQFVLMLPKEAIVDSVLGNLGHMRTVLEGSAPAPEIERQYAERYVREHAGQFDGVDFGAMKERIGGMNDAVYENSQYVAEKERLETMNDRRALVRGIVDRTIPGEERLAVIAILRRDVAGLRDYLYDSEGVRWVPEGASHAAEAFLDELKKKLDELGATDREGRDATVEQFLRDLSR